MESGRVENLFTRAGRATGTAERLCLRSRELIEEHARIHTSSEFDIRGQVDGLPVAAFWRCRAQASRPLHDRADLKTQVDAVFGDDVGAVSRSDPCLSAALTFVRACDKVERFTYRPDTARKVDVDSIGRFADAKYAVTARP